MPDEIAAVNGGSLDQFGARDPNRKTWHSMWGDDRIRSSRATIIHRVLQLAQADRRIKGYSDSKDCHSEPYYQASLLFSMARPPSWILRTRSGGVIADNERFRTEYPFQLCGGLFGNGFGMKSTGIDPIAAALRKINSHHPRPVITTLQ